MVNKELPKSSTKITSTTSHRNSTTVSIPSPSTSSRRNSNPSGSRQNTKNSNDKSSEKSERTSKPIVKNPASKTLIKPPTTKTNTKTHKSHPQHPLEMMNRKFAYKCDGCKLRGVGRRYVCSPCKYNLHVDCISARNKITFQGNKCMFHLRPLKCKAVVCTHGDNYCRSCDACGTTIEGFVYHCEETDMDFHPSCTKLKTEIRVEDVIFKLQKQASSKCLRCQRKKLQGSAKNVRGWTYISNHKGYKFHVHCLMDMIMQLSSSSKTTTLEMIKPKIPFDSMIIGIIMGVNWENVLQKFLMAVVSLLMGTHPATLGLSLAVVGVKSLIELLTQH